MDKSSNPKNKPLIIVRESDYARLNDLAQASLDRNYEVADELLGELERASVVLDDQVASNVVQMGSTVTYETDGQPRTVTLVYPADADIEQGKISILTPIGVALLGLSPGQSIDWRARGGQSHRLKVTAVRDHSPLEEA
ncbi:MAG TPA: nucleoside diphosphate kinase regulator [Mycoplana sp.]|jgi:regulator of nucleoside diphosphate kinase|nr:nucleoside diphosphate kinase regulator [Mycoplana sp.]